MKDAWNCLAAALVLLAAIILTSDLAALMGGSQVFVPQVCYERPKDGSELDLSAADIVVFQWSNVPMPGSGRERFHFALYRETSPRQRIISEDLDARVFSMQIGKDKFENGAEYSWYVKQRDDRTMVWSRYDVWYFKVKKIGAQ